MLVVVLKDWVKGDAMGIERLDQLGEVRQRAGQPIDLIDDDDVDPPGLDIDEQVLERQANHRAAAESRRRRNDPEPVASPRALGS
jgi:hypothetical protein